MLSVNNPNLELLMHWGLASEEAPKNFNAAQPITVGFDWRFVLVLPKISQPTMFQMKLKCPKLRVVLMIVAFDDFATTILQRPSV